MGPGETLGAYRVLRKLGEGGMGAVYLAYDTTLHRHVALKALDAPADDASARTRLVREARNAAALSHPHICTIHEVDEAGGTPFIAMEYVEGVSLRERVDSGAVPVDEAVRLGLQAADALAYAHAHGVVHRDFKAANAIVTGDGRLKVVDFGLARRGDALVAGATTEVSLVAAGVAAGTPYAMAPEQVRGEAADARTDIWALGVLLYELVSGRKPFEAPTIPELFSAILTKTPAALPGAVPVELKAVIERCLTKDPGHRYQQASEVHAALEAIQAGAVSPWVVWRYYVRRRPALTGAATLVALAALLVGANVGGVRDRLAGTPPALPPIRLAVLPFENLTGDPEQEYLSDGLTEEMIGQLGRLHPARLSVIARTSSMQYKGRSAPLDEVARALNVDYVLEGSTRREGSRVRINATLIRVADQIQQWSESFDRDLAGILTLQNDVARGVAGSLALALLPEERTTLAFARPVNPAVHEAYLKGRFHWYRHTPEDFARAQSYFEDAIRIDPDYAPAYIGLADAVGTPAHIGRIPTTDVFPRLKALVAKALALDDQSAVVHDMHARITFAYDWEWAASEAAFQRAIALNPNYPDAHVVYAQLLQILGRGDEALAAVQHGLDLDPHNAFFQQQRAHHLLVAGRRQEAIAEMEELLRVQPGFPPAHEILWTALLKEGQYDEAVRHAGPMDVADILSESYPTLGYAGAMSRAADTMAARALAQYVSPVLVARLYAHAGDQDRTLDWLEKAIDVHDTQIVYAPMSPEFEDVWDHPRFRAVMRRINLPAYTAQ
jgi:eukaryotic-like serine/threonine-protein kinase